MMHKERKHILRDWQTLMIVIAMPLVMMFLYGYALTLDIQDVKVIIEDPAHSRAGRYITQSIDASEMFKVIAVKEAVSDPSVIFKTYNIKALFKLPPDLDQRLEAGTTPAHITVLIDGSDPNTGTIIRNLSKAFTQNVIIEYLNFEPPKVVTIHPYILYNPLQESSLFFVPGLMAIILIMLSTLLTSLTITREKERGTIKQLFISPLHPFEIIAGKILPYIFIAAFDAVLILIAGYFFFNVAVNGSMIFLAFCTTVYITTCLTLGLIFSTVAKNQVQAMFMALPATLLPTIVLSGFIFPLSSMPLFLRGVSQVIPATYYLQLIRGIILKGAGIDVLWKPLLILSGIGMFFLIVAIKRFKVRL
jgi:ABC-2 type transport system permease protein